MHILRIKDVRLGEGKKHVELCAREDGRNNEGAHRVLFLMGRLSHPPVNAWAVGTFMVGLPEQQLGLGGVMEHVTCVRVNLNRTNQSTMVAMACMERVMGGWMEITKLASCMQFGWVPMRACSLS